MSNPKKVKNDKSNTHADDNRSSEKNTKEPSEDDGSETKDTSTDGSYKSEDRKPDPNDASEVKIETKSDDGPIQRDATNVADDVPEKVKDSPAPVKDDSKQPSSGGDSGGKGGQQMYKEETGTDIDMVNIEMIAPMVPSKPFSGFGPEMINGIDHGCLWQFVVTENFLPRMVTSDGGASIPFPALDADGVGGMDVFLQYRSREGALSNAKLAATLGSTNDASLMVKYRMATAKSAWVMKLLTPVNLEFETRGTPDNGNGNRFPDGLGMQPPSRVLSWIDIFPSLTPAQVETMAYSPCFTNMAYLKMPNPYLPFPAGVIGALDDVVPTLRPIYSGANRKIRSEKDASGKSLPGENWTQKFGVSGQFSAFGFTATVHPAAAPVLSAALVRHYETCLPGAETDYASDETVRATRDRFLFEVPSASILQAGLLSRILMGEFVYRSGLYMTRVTDSSIAIGSVITTNNTQIANSFNVSTKSTLSTDTPEDLMKSALQIRAGNIQEVKTLPDVVMMFFALLTYKFRTPFSQWSSETPVRMILSMLVRLLDILPVAEQGFVAQAVFSSVGFGANGTNLRRASGATGPAVTVRSYLTDMPNYLPFLYTNRADAYVFIRDHDEISDETKTIILFMFECLDPIITKVRVTDCPTGPLYIDKNGNHRLAWQQYETGARRGVQLMALEERAGIAVANIKMLLAILRTEKLELQSAQGVIKRGMELLPNLQFFERIHPNAMVPTVSFYTEPTLLENGDPSLGAVYTTQSEWGVVAGAKNGHFIRRPDNLSAVVSWKSFAASYFKIAGVTENAVPFVTQARDNMKKASDFGSKLVGAMTALDSMVGEGIIIPASVARGIYRDQGFTAYAAEMAKGATAEQSRDISIIWKGADNQNPNTVTLFNARFDAGVSLSSTDSTSASLVLSVEIPPSVTEFAATGLVICNKVTVSGTDPHCQMLKALYNQVKAKVEEQGGAGEFVTARRQHGVLGRRSRNKGDLGLYDAANVEVVHDVQELEIDGTSPSMGGRVLPSDRSVTTGTSVVGITLPKINWIEADKWAMIPDDIKKAIIFGVEQGRFGWLYVKDHFVNLRNELLTGDQKAQYDLASNIVTVPFCQTSFPDTSNLFQRVEPRVYCLGPPVGTPVCSIGNPYSFKNEDTDFELLQARPVQAINYLHEVLPFPQVVPIGTTIGESGVNSTPITYQFTAINGTTELEIVQTGNKVSVENRGYDYF